MAGRLFDKVMATPLEKMELPKSAGESLEALRDWKNIAEHIKELMVDAEVIGVDMVAKYYYEHQCQMWKIHRDFPNLAPPFENFFMEYKPVPYVLECDSPTGTEHDHEKYPVRLRDTRYETTWTGCHVEVREFEDERMWDDMRWVLNCTPVLYRERDDKVLLAPCRWHIFVNQNGEFRSMKLSIFTGDRERDAARFADDETAIPSEYHGMMLAIVPCLLGICFMHCGKNIELREGQITQQQDKKWKKRYGRPLVRFHQLYIDPMQKVLEQAGASKKTGLSKAIHICRGHFAHYGEKYGKGKLFGKYEGMVWHPQHVKGTVTEGIMYKNYNVKPDPKKIKPDEAA